ncbi:MAG: DUF3833 family protein [Betaproteobacteria bacterium]|nr:DUF3833 family protein [Betaproteobacteria bacterium]
MTSSRSTAFETIPDTLVDTLWPQTEREADAVTSEPAPAAGLPALPERVLRVEEYFNGTLWADGLLLDRRGRVRRRFHVDMRGQWEGDWGRLHEAFVFDDGERQQRTWSLRRLPEQDGVRRYEATAGDVVGTARGRARGHELRWNYVLAIPVGGRTYNIRMDDRMYLMDERLLINRTDMRKFGFRVGSLFVSFGKP